MQGHNQPDFKLDLDDESPDKLIQEEMHELRMEKLNQRITLLSILFPILILVILFIAYFDISKKVSKFQNTGTLEVVNLSRELESNFSALSVKFAKLETLVDKKNTSFDNAISAIQIELKKTEKNISGLKSSKTDKKELARSIKKIDKKFLPLQKDFKKAFNKVASDITSLGKELTQLKQAVDTVGNDVKNAKEEISASKAEISELSSAKIGKDVLDLEMKNISNTFQTRLDETINKVEVKFLSINKRINELKKQAAAISKKQAFIQKAVSTRKPVIQPKTETRTKSKPTPASKKVLPVKKDSAPNQKAAPSSSPPSSGSTTLKPGTIVEQDIKE